MSRGVVCKPKANGGLGVRNIAYLGKYIWAVAKKADNVWVKWVHSVYLKQQDWWEYVPPREASWSWKVICRLKMEMKGGFLSNGWGSGNAYTIKAGYK